MVSKSEDGYSEITRFLAVGKADTHGGPKISELKENLGINVVVDLNDKKSEALASKKVGLKYIGSKLPFIPSPSRLVSLSKSIDREVNAKQKVYVHCHKGIYRAPTAAVAYLIYKGMSTDRAVKEVRDKRPSALPGIEDSQRLIPVLREFENKVRANERKTK